MWAGKSKSSQGIAPFLDRFGTGGDTGVAIPKEIVIKSRWLCTANGRSSVREDRESRLSLIHGYIVILISFFLAPSLSNTPPTD